MNLRQGKRLLSRGHGIQTTWPKVTGLARLTVECQHDGFRQVTRFQSKSGYTLLKVVLALALSVLVMGGITMAINYHLITLREQQE